MRIFISADIEGVAGLVHYEEANSLEAEYQPARAWMTGEVNAAIQGAFAAGADDVVVNDSHGSMRNLLADKLDQRAHLVRGRVKPMMMMEGAAVGDAAAFFIGYHAKAGTGGGILNHTFSGLIYKLSLNGQEVGETGFNAAIGGAMGIPLALVSGDEALRDEVEALLPWTERVAVKRGITSWTAETTSPEMACQLIRQGAERAIRRLGEMKLYTFPGPVRMEVTFHRPIHADLASWIPTAERIDGRTVAFTSADMFETNRAWATVLNVMAGQQGGYG
jgi:D-amino peptidase